MLRVALAYLDHQNEINTPPSISCAYLPCSSETESQCLRTCFACQCTLQRLLRALMVTERRSAMALRCLKLQHPTRVFTQRQVCRCVRIVRSGVPVISASSPQHG